MNRVRCLLLGCLMMISALLNAQRGVHGPRTVSAANTIVNEYTALGANAPAGSTTITVANSALNANSRFTGGLAAGDLIMIIQIQGVSINGILNGTTAWPIDTSWGQITNYNDCGRYEFAEVVAVPNATTIQIGCGLTYSYSTGGTNRAQVIRVPRYTALTVNNGGVLTCDTWNGSTGGVLAVEVLGNTVINAGGIIDATGKGFRGGVLGTDNLTNFGVNNVGSTDPSFGADKGEGVFGYQADYDPVGGRYGRGAVGNAGGGGCAHNGGGGGGANGGIRSIWKGWGIPDLSGPNWNTAWSLEPPVNTINTLNATNSSGGGKGGYSFSGNNGNAITQGPSNNGAWGGDSRRHDAAGYGGRPLDYSTGRIFLGGGGGAGDQNQSYGGNGGNGGGLIYIMNYGTVSGTGVITSNGNNGSNAQGAPPANSYSGRDGAGGGGGGGTVIVNSVGTISGISITCNGGNGGNQVMTPGPFFFGAINEAEGPGGGGGGGYIGISNGAITCTTNGGNNGTTNSGALTEFTPNGATRGAPGTNNGSITNFTITANNVTICSGQTATLTATLNGTVPPGTVINWYANQVGGVPLGSGASFTTPVLVSTTTYYVGTCPGTYHQAVTVTVNPAPVLTVNPAAPSVCSGVPVSITAGGANTYAWSPATGLSATTGATVSANPTATTTYTITGTGANGCTGTTTVTVTVSPGPTITANPAAPSYCAGGSVVITAGGANTYTWGPATGLSATTGATVTANPAATTTYTITGTAVSGCTNTTTVTVTVNPAPTITVNPASPSVCSGMPVSITAGGANTYTWGPSTGLSATTGATVTANPTTTTTYTITGTSALGCTNTTTVTVTINNNPTITATPAAPSYCAGGSVSITAGGANTYTWGPATGLSATTGATVTANPTVTTTYTITGTAASGCTNTTTVTVTVNPAPTITANPASPSVCIGNSVTLTAAGGNTYAWSPATGLSATTGASVTANPTATTTYTVTGTGANGCTNTTTVTVTVDPLPVVTITPAGSSICNGGSVSLTAGGAATYTWGPASGLSATTGAAVTASPTATTTYTITGTSAAGCTNTATTTVTVNPAPVITANPANTVCCIGASFVINASGASTYVWSPATGLSASTGASVMATPTVTTVYTITGTDVNGCTNTTIVSITVFPLPTVSAGPDQSVCSSSSVALNGSSNATSYSWVPATGLSSTTVINPVASPTATTTYILYVLDANGCSNSDTVVVSVGPAITLTTGGNISFCAGGSDTISVNASGGTPGFSYNWSPSGTLSSSTASNPLASPTATTTYTVLVTDAAGCTQVDSVTVTVNAIPVANAGNDQSICLGGSASLSASGGTSYSWTPSTGLSSTTVNNPSASPASTTTYIVTVSNGSCSDDDTIVVTVNPLPVVSAGADDTICSGGNTTLNASGSGTFAWTPSGSLSNSTIQNPVASPSSTTTYYVTLTDANSCTNTDSVTIVVIACAAPNAQITSSSTSVCEGGCINFSDNSTGLPDTWSWSFPGGSPASSTQQNPGAVCYASAGTYTVTLISSNSFGSDTTVMSVTVNPIPVADAGPAVSISTGSSTTLNGTGGGSYSWAPVTGLSCTTCPNPTANPTVTTTYTLFVSANGCFSSDTVTVSVTDQFEWFVPSAFSPNGDGMNDILFVRGVGVKTVHLVIYDRVGEKVFETNDISIGWDGTFKGQAMNNAVFVYYATVEFLDGTFESKKGDVTLVR
ncbi:MAG: gliding motility-associated C-terminal domain-containing protein [Bacteroidota bacterium]